jgi:gluconolactonase
MAQPQALLCKGCWQNLHLPVALRGPLSVPFRVVGLKPSRMNPNTCTFCELMFTRVMRRPRSRSTPPSCSPMRVSPPAVRQEEDAQLESRAPSGYRSRNNIGSETMTDDVKTLATGLGFPEGPVAMPDGSVILTEIRNRRCARVTADGKVSVFSDNGGGPNGLAVGPDGALYCCNNGGSRYVEGKSMGQGPHPDYKHGSIQRLDRTTGEARTLYTECDGHKLSAPNDLVFDTSGGFYFTDLGKRYARHRDHGGIYYARPDGSKITCLVYPFLSPNGCGLSPDGKVLYVADTASARLYAYDIEAPGVLAKTKADFAHTGRVVGGAPAGPAGFDSLAVLANGNICVATLTTGKITEFAPDGKIVREVKMPDVYPTNICFGGPDMRTAYITLSDKGQLGVMQWPTPGLKLNYN